MLQVKSARSKTAAGTHKTETFPIPRVLIVGMSRDEAIFEGLSTKEAIVDTIPVYYGENLEGKVIEQSGSEATVM